MTTTANQPRYGLILFPNILNSARSLAPEGSDSAILLTALGDLRFHGADPEEIRGRLLDYNLIAFELLSEKIIRAMSSYKKKCAQSSNSCSSESRITGGGMYLDDDDLRTLAYATEGTEAEPYFYALYQVHSGEADMDTVEKSLPRGARMVFRETRKALFGEPPKKLSRSEINRKNAQRGWAKRKAAKKAAEKSPVPNETELIQPSPVSEPSLSAELPEENETAKQADNDSEKLLLPVPDADKHFNSEDPACQASMESSYEDANDANACKRDAKVGSQLPNNKEKDKEKEKSLPPSPLHDSHVPEEKDHPRIGYKKLRAKFEELYAAYPKHEEPGRAWGAFLSLNPDEELIEEIFRGLNAAKEQDRRFRSEYRYIPLLCNWIGTQGWKSENTHHLTDSAAGRQPDSSCPSPYMPVQRSRTDRVFVDQRGLAAVQELRKLYG